MLADTTPTRVLYYMLIVKLHRPAWHNSYTEREVYLEAYERYIVFLICCCC